MSETGIVAVIVAILGVLGGGGYWGYRQSRREAPVKKRDADLAVADKSQQMAMAIADDLRGDYDRLRAEFNTEREQRQRLTGRVEGLEVRIREQDDTITKLRTVARAFHEAWDDLGKRWEYYRTLDRPPTLPPYKID